MLAAMLKKHKPGEIVHLEDYRPSDYLIPRLSLDFGLDAGSTRVTANLTIERRKDVKPGAPLVLDGDELTLESIALDGKPLAATAFIVNEQALVLKHPPAGRFELTIVTRLAPEANTRLMGLYQSNGVFCTQCEAEGFRRITFFLDRPDVLSVYTVRIEADALSFPVLLSNGNPGKTGKLPGGRHFAIWHDPFPKPSYLFALVAGDLGKITDTFTTMSGQTVALAIYVERGKEARAAYAMDALKRAMRWDEERFGREYDLEVFNIVAVSDFIIGAMENKGLNIFNDKYILADPDTATDADFAAIEAIVAHEYFHNWTGNRITCRDWFQLCLKEGLTVYRDHEFSADQRSRAVRRVAEVRALRANQFPEDQGPLAHPVRPTQYREINNFYTSTVYEKGSEIVRMLHTALGEETFARAMNIYFERHDGEAATVEEFVAAFETASGQDLSQFALWYHQPGTPHVSASSTYDARRRRFTIELEQSTPFPVHPGRRKPLHIPLSFGLLGHNGDDLASDPEDSGTVAKGVIHLRKRRQTIVLDQVSSEPVLSINRGFSAPIIMRNHHSFEQQLRLARSDSDLFNRWEALNRLMLGDLCAATARARRGESLEFNREIIALLGDIAEDSSLEAAYRALAIAIPSESDIARELAENIEPLAIQTARRAMASAIAKQHGATFVELYKSLASDETFSPDADSAGRRALRIALLGHLESGPGGQKIARLHFDAARNMTDRLAALTTLVHRFGDTADAVNALDSYEAKYGDDPLAMDKWFTVQATTPNEAALDTVKRLTAHTAYAVNNPNRVRALIGAYASANQAGFNRADGAGYSYLAQTVLAIDPLNPRLAARLATSLRAWRSLESVRRQHARSALSLLAASKQISVDLRDIVERTLG